MLSILLACTPATSIVPKDTDSVPADSDEPPALTGQPPENPVPLPDFAALNQDGEPRGPQDLLGQPTVIWFFPNAEGAT